MLAVASVTGLSMLDDSGCGVAYLSQKLLVSLYLQILGQRSLIHFRGPLKREGTCCQGPEVLWSSYLLGCYICQEYLERFGLMTMVVSFKCTVLAML